MKNCETIQEQNFRLRQLALKTAKETNHKSFIYISKGISKKIEL
jgi:hypothetical protein